jgi:hypothetical protein
METQFTHLAQLDVHTLDYVKAVHQLEQNGVRREGVNGVEVSAQWEQPLHVDVEFQNGLVWIFFALLGLNNAQNKRRDPKL